MEDLIEEYQSSLEDLTFNSKPHINMLTILAEENKQHAELIVRRIEARLAEASQKLPIMYLLDSIVKNVGENYKALFAKDLVKTFKTAFEAADDKSKMSLYKLRTTWGEYFSLKKLHALDMEIKTRDPNWPVKPLPSNLQEGVTTNIHVNPKFLKKNEIHPKVTKTHSSSAAKVKQPKQNAVKPSSADGSSSQSTDVETIRQQLVRQQKELLDLQQKKLMLELEQTKQQLEAKQREASLAVKKQDTKVSKDPRLQTAAHQPPTGLKVTLTNEKVVQPNAPAKSAGPKDPRLKSADKGNKAMSKNNVSAPKKAAEVSKVSKNSSPAKKKSPKVIKEKIALQEISKESSSSKSPPAVKQAKLKTSSKEVKKRKEKSTSLGEENEASAESEKRKKRSFQKNQRSPLLPPPKIPRRNDLPPKSSRHIPFGSEKRHGAERENRRLQTLREHRPSPRSSEGSMSPRFSPEPSDDNAYSEQCRPLPKRPRPFEQRDALLRRPSFDPDLEIPQELTLGHQSEILKQANRQLQHGQLTHGQHQELLKQLHQLFELQRLKREVQGGPPPPEKRVRERRSRSPIDPRRRARGACERPDIPEDFFDDRYSIPLRGPGLGKQRPYLPLRNDGHPTDDRRNEPHLRDRGPPRSRGMSKQFRPGFEKRFTKPRPSLRGSRRPLPPPGTGLAPRSRPPNPNSDERMQKSPPPELRQMSPPPFLRELDASKKNVLEVQHLPPEKPLAPNSEKQSMRRFAHGDRSKEKWEDSKDDPRKNKDHGQNTKVLEQRKEGAKLLTEHLDEKLPLEEPEDYIIANIPKSSEETKPKLEEPEDYIIARLEERKESCEEPEDFIIANIPPGAEAYHKHSMGLKRNTESEKAYMDHMKKIKQSIYTKELKDARIASESSTEGADESASEKSSAEADCASKKSEEVLKSPPLPLKKRRYVSDEDKPKHIKKEAEDSSDISLGDQNIEPRNPENVEQAEIAKESEVLRPIKIEPVDSPAETPSSSVDIKIKEEPIETSSDVVPKLEEKESVELDVKPSASGENSHDIALNDEKQSLDEGLEGLDPDNPLVYVIDEDEQMESFSKQDPRRQEPRQGRGRHMPRGWRMHDDEEARIQMMMASEQKQMEWEDTLHRELEMEHWNEERRMNTLPWRNRERGGRFAHMDRWESPPREPEDPPPFDIAHGNIRGERSRLLRPRPIRPDGRMERDRRFAPGARGRHPPGHLRPRRRSPLPPERRLPPPHLPDDRRPPDWDLPPTRLPPRDPPFHPDRKPFPEENSKPSLELCEPAVPQAPINQVNVNKLLSDLLNMGILPGNTAKSEKKNASPVPQEDSLLILNPDSSSTNESTRPKVSNDKAEETTRSVSPYLEEDLMTLDPDAKLPNITLTSDLKIRHGEIIKRLYTGIQCSACGLRFTTRQTDLYADHLDWHYRINRKDKEGGAQTHREIYPAAGEWICFEEAEDSQERSKNPFFEESECQEGFVQQTDENNFHVPLTGAPGEDSCKVCKEAFETFYNEADDEWQFADCIKVDGENFHPNCHGDHFELTPLPTQLKMPTHDPVDDHEGIPGFAIENNFKEEVDDNNAQKIVEVKEEESKQDVKIDIEIKTEPDVTVKFEHQEEEDTTSDNHQHSGQPAELPTLVAIKQEMELADFGASEITADNLNHLDGESTSIKEKTMHNEAHINIDLETVESKLETNAVDAQKVDALTFENSHEDNEMDTTTVENMAASTSENDESIEVSSVDRINDMALNPDSLSPS
ncbi:uncharacterized protein LOC143464631 isoform X2 [Clavelina lepadiformis]|uniref:uncharacterized protein LOC143464631 isoform X2 n=1 Tax=Clavelina lepadiformis TaxID=159417 RepID=UPI00404352CF